MDNSAVWSCYSETAEKKKIENLATSNINHRNFVIFRAIPKVKKRTCRPHSRLDSR